MTSADNSSTDGWSTSQGTILIVDDDAVNGRVLARMVELLGYRAFVVENGAEAVQALQAAEYDVVLMDMQMPVMDGFEATRTIRSGVVRHRHVPIVAVTAASFPNERERFLEAGMDDFIAKPVMQGVLATVLERFTGARPASPIDVTEHEITGEPMSEAKIAQLETTLGDEFQSVLAQFCQLTAERIDAVDVAVDDGDVDEVRQLAHSIKGSAQTFGCEGVGEAANLLQLSLGVEDRTLWADAAWRLRVQYNELRDLLRGRYADADI